MTYQEETAMSEQDGGTERITIDPDDYRLELSRHVASGELYVLKYNSVWDAADECVGVTYTACSGPLAQHEWLDEAGQPLVEWLDLAYAHLGNNSEGAAQDAEWANEQEWFTLIVEP